MNKPLLLIPFMKIYLAILSLLMMAHLPAQPFAYRQLVIFSNTSSADLKKQQLQLLKKDAPGVNERDLKIVDAEKDEALYRKYKADRNTFTVILVGKDGYEKYR